VRARSIHYTDQGSSGAPTLVVAPSLGTTTAMWDPQVQHLTAWYRLVVIDHRGHGGSEVVPGAATIADLAGDVLVLLDRLGIERCSWAGLSLGGMVGMWLAAHHPGRIERLALLSTAAHLPPAQAWHERAATVRAAGTGAVADTVVARWFTARFRDRVPTVVDTHRAMLLSTPAEGYAACCEAIATMDLRPVLARVAAATLVIVGADDPATPPPFAAEIAEAIRGARVEVVSDAAHLVNVEQADLVTKLLVEHFAG
jgi:3-oxoadipate enol-lactonase